jgi:hypothetical protein
MKGVGKGAWIERQEENKLNKKVENQKSKEK